MGTGELAEVATAGVASSVDAGGHGPLAMGSVVGGAACGIQHRGAERSKRMVGTGIDTKTATFT